MPSEWTVLFFLKGIPQSVWCESANIRMRTGPALLDLYSKVMNVHGELGAFSADPAKDGVCFAFVKMHREDEGDALEAGSHLLGHVLDCVNIATGESPKIATLALLRSGDEPNVRVRVYVNQAWMAWEPRGA